MRTIVPKRHPADEQPRHRATSWHRGPDPDAEISFADIAAMPDPDWIGRSQQAGFAFDAELLEPLELTDWQARISAHWAEIDAGWDLLKSQADGAADDFASSRYSYNEAWGSLFTALADNAAELDDDRAALFADINAERALLAKLKAQVA